MSKKKFEKLLRSTIGKKEDFYCSSVNGTPLKVPMPLLTSKHTLSNERLRKTIVQFDSSVTKYCSVDCGLEKWYFHAQEKYVYCGPIIHGCFEKIHACRQNKIAEDEHTFIPYLST